MSKLCTQEYYTSFVMEQVRAVRLRAGVTLAQIATACNCSEACVSEWEQSPRPDITLKQLVQYAHTCGMSPHAITYREKAAWEEAVIRI